MFITSVVRSLIGVSRPKRGRGRQERDPVSGRQTCLSVEQLETRALPSTFTVLNLNDSGPGSLRQAIRAANAAAGHDLIQFADDMHGTITLTRGELSVSDSLTLRGSLTERLVVSGNNASRVFHIEGTASVTLSDLTISSGAADIGGGILNEAGASLTLRNCTLRGNQAGTSFDLGGGGALWNGGSAEIADCTFADNRASGEQYGYGGAIENLFGTLNITRTLFIGNRATGSVSGADADGVAAGSGAIDTFDGQVTVSHSTFIDNEAVATGVGANARAGAIMNYDSDLTQAPVATVTIINCTFRENRAITLAGGDGVNVFGNAGAGAVENARGTMTIVGSDFSQNVALGGQSPAGAVASYWTASTGGAIYAYGNGQTTVTDTTFTANNVVGGAGGTGGGGNGGLGGAIWIDEGMPLTVTRCTFTGNTAVGGAGGAGGTGGEGAGGAIDLGAGCSAIIFDSAFRQNKAIGGAGGQGATGGKGVGGAINAGDAGLYPNDITGTSSLTVNGCMFVQNLARGGAGSSGGDGLGGAVSVIAGTARVSTSTFGENVALGGRGLFGDGGDGLGGSFYTGEQARVNLRETTVTQNQAVGGAGTIPGLGQGGGIYMLVDRTVGVDSLTIIYGNFASTSDEDVFGHLRLIS